MLPIPTASVWGLTSLSNGDLVASCSDGKAWIFSRDPKRAASEAVKEGYEAALSNHKRPAQSELEGVDVDQLPGKEALLREGKRDGATLMVRDGGVISVHHWSEGEIKT